LLTALPDINSDSGINRDIDNDSKTHTERETDTVGRQTLFQEMLFRQTTGIES